MKEEQSLEKDLILEQVHRLIERLSTKVDAGKDDTLALAKKVNDLQNKIKDITRKMMATLSEMTIYQADALKLQQEKNMKDVELQQCYARIEQVRDRDRLLLITSISFKGEPPSEELEREWYRKSELEHRQNAERRLREEVRVVVIFKLLFSWTFSGMFSRRNAKQSTFSSQVA